VLNPDLAIYLAHAAFYSVFSVRVFGGIRSGRVWAGSEVRQGATEGHTASFSRALIVFHGVGFALLYSGIGSAVIPRRVPHWFTGQRIVGSAVIAMAASLVAWALVSFQSWRVRAKIEPGHQLATRGPFRLVRHPIYAGIDLLALGTALWIPAPIVWLGFVLIAIGGDLRARAEEALLEKTFGRLYHEYCFRTRRFLPGIY
jgi:protein-S-isoprenylcysteine O-methyltransferase Ste14